MCGFFQKFSNNPTFKFAIKAKLSQPQPIIGFLKNTFKQAKRWSVLTPNEPRPFGDTTIAVINQQTLIKKGKCYYSQMNA